MHVSAQVVSDIFGGTAFTLVYSAIWRHAPAKFPRTLDAWWAWIRGSNQEIAAQRSGSPDPTPPAEPASTQKEG